MAAKPKLTKAEADANRLRVLSGRFESRFYGRKDASPAPELEEPPEATYEPEPPRKTTRAGNRTRTPSEKERPPLLPEPVPKAVGVILPWDDPHLRLPYVVLREALRKLKPAPRVVLEELYRASAGWHSSECIISVAKLSRHCQIKPTQVRDHLKHLESAGYIKRLGNVLGGTDLEARGIRFRVNLPRLAPSEKHTGSENQPRRKTGPNKESFKESYIKPPTPEEVAEFERNRAEVEGAK